MRKMLLPAIVIGAAVLLLIRIFYLQIIDDSFKLKSENNAIKINYNYPERGYIYDRYGKLLVANQPSYDIMVTPRYVKDIDTLELCNLLHITKQDFLRKLEKAKTYSPMLRSVFLPQLNKQEYAAFQEKARKFSGFEIQKRSLRDYQVAVGANVFGFITQVNERIISKQPYYKSGDLIGKQGVEESYEEILRGVKGVKYLQKDKYNREIGSYKEGKFDTVAVQGKDIKLTIDIELQKYGEALMKNKRGGIVAIDPKSGEILALVTAPSYNPALLVGRERSKNYTMLYNDSLAKPTYDRGLLAEYPPGSPFKILTGLVALQEQVIDEETTFFCHHGIGLGRGHFMKCHGGSGPHQLHNGIYRSCNAYFANAYLRTIGKYKAPKAVDIWSNHVKSFGLGQFMGYDLPTGRKGHVPDAAYYKKVYPNGGWGGTTIVSNSIGQGEILTTPIQLANMIATVANKGYYYTPHIIKNIEGQLIDIKFRTKHQTSIDPKYFDPVISGLFDVYNHGTAHGLGVPGINLCGKTGTAENYAKIYGRRVKLQDHSIFVAFAPMENPKIAIAVFVENGGFGANIAGPIVSLMIEKYIKKKITLTRLEQRMFNTSLQPLYNRYENKPTDTIKKETTKPLVPKNTSPETKPAVKPADKPKPNTVDAELDLGNP
ncbi:penicillin-binding protein 2 [Flavobacterium branchiophilum NBRC 15030 = ATCC 35035]|uniref:Penicillin-binding protein 2 n=1 Tax=Flavobacterium branchiophilum TaxID=55197 RepID=A0A543G3U8_9FLAO|nr:penicillin-binding protein 2 [Flavobacterium branchiophilum]OXA77623.1 penicillin-binding protein 2 [Flavobacterium branchiophilum NBRC 15030 = ATCC 35035]TQM40694.1 penicillin-binding protein 2 [Flavobacterium branchiophilum]GEM54227.1 penicillin-binding protein 2 [Flavobacterium branchiophilum NBRC 15030 = ATCC 35035]